MKRVVLGLLVAVVCGVAGLLWLGRPNLTELLRRRLEQEITRAARSPCHITNLELSWSPLGARLDGLVVGPELPLAEVARADVQLLTLASLEEFRPVLDVRIEGVTIDTTRLAGRKAAEPEKEGGTAWPPLHLRAFDLVDAELRFKMGKTVATLTVAEASGHAEMHPSMEFTAGLEVTGVALQHKSYQVRLDQIHAEGGADAGGLFLREASVKGEHLTASVNAGSKAHQHTVSATFDPGVLGVLVDELSFVGGEAELQGQLNGDLANPNLDGSLTIKHAAIASHMLGDFDARVTHEGTRLGFADLHLVGTRGQVTGAVQLHIHEEMPIEGELSWDGVDLARFLGVIGVRVPFDNRFDATTSVHGALDPLDLDVRGTGVTRAGAADAEKPVADWEIGGRVRPHAVEARFDLTQPERNRVSVRFQFEDPALSGTVNVSASNLAKLNTLLPSPVPALALTGAAEVAATFSGTTQHPSVGGTVTMKDITVVGTAVPRLSGDFLIAAEQLRTRSVKLETLSGSAELSGALALDEGERNDWQLSWRDLNTDLVLGLARGFSGIETPLNGGTLGGTLRCRGPWSRLDTQGNLSARAPRIASEPLERVDVKITTSLPEWTAHLNAVHTGTETLKVDASGDGWKRLDVAVDSTPLHLATWRGAARRHVVGTLALHGRITGAPEQSDGWLELTGAGLGVRDRKLGAVALRADGRRGEWTLKGNAYGDALDLTGTLRTTGALPYTLGVTWHEPDLAAVVGTEGQLQITTSGELHLSGSLREKRFPNGTLAVSQLAVSRGGYHIAAPEPIRVDVDDGRFRIRTLILEGEGGRLTVSGDWSAAGQVNLDVQANGDLHVLEVIGPPVYSARGLITARAQVLHQPETGWDLAGEVTVRDAALDADLPLTFTDANGNLVLHGGQIRIEHFTGRAGGGEFSLGGALDLNHGPAVSWSVKDIALTLPEWLEERVSGQGQVEGTWRALTVRGDIEVLNALYDRRIELSDLVPSLKQQLAPAPGIGPSVVTVNLDLHVHASGGLFVDNNLAKLELAADLRVRGTAAKPVLSGTLEFVEGEVTFRKRIFTINAGSIDFRDPFKINPVLNISADAQISTSEGEYTLTVTVTGTADEPRVQFSADDPSLTQNDIVSLITSGKTTAQLQREGGGVSMSDVLTLVPTGSVEERFRNILSVDTFEITSTSDHATGSIEPRVVIGKNITDRLRTEVSSSFGLQTRPKAELEYRFTRRISLLGSWASDSSSNAGVFGGEVRFRYEFRRLPFTLLDTTTNGAAQDETK